MRFVLAALLAGGMMILFPDLPVQASPAAAKTPKSRSAKSKSTSKTKSASSKRKTGKRVARSRRSKKSARASFQAHPTAERYKEIQQALADKGYYKGEVDGTWGPDSVDALKRFQADNKMQDDGKITSLALIGLGLGPKHDGSTAALVGSPPATPVPGAEVQQSPAPSQP